ncbi:Clr5 domain-containing protein [Microdochium nivale]|nr:Clr5 domain-containing protein [Microdochium nivale]
MDDNDTSLSASRRGRPQSDGADELDYHRAEIKALRRQKRTLKQIMAVMAAKYSCTASTSTYKRKLKAWGSHQYAQTERRGRADVDIHRPRGADSDPATDRVQLLCPEPRLPLRIPNNKPPTSLFGEVESHIQLSKRRADWTPFPAAELGTSFAHERNIILTNLRAMIEWFESIDIYDVCKVFCLSQDDQETTRLMEVIPLSVSNRCNHIRGTMNVIIGEINIMFEANIRSIHGSLLPCQILSRHPPIPSAPSPYVNHFSFREQLLQNTKNGCQIPGPTIGRDRRRLPESGQKHING